MRLFDFLFIEEPIFPAILRLSYCVCCVSGTSGIGNAMIEFIEWFKQNNFAKRYGSSQIPKFTHKFCMLRVNNTKIVSKLVMLSYIVYGVY